jgi:hypothetical protein
MPLTLKFVQGDVWQIYAICDEKGETFLDALDPDEKEGVKIAANLARWASVGSEHFPSERMHLIDPATRLYQLRINDCRIMWFYDQHKVIICCHGYRKKSTKIPSGELTKGNAAKAAYLEAKQQGQIKFQGESEQ